MSVLFLLLLTFAQYLMGSGLLKLLRLKMKRGLFRPLAVICGIGICSLLPFLLELCHIPLTALNIFVFVIAITAVSSYILYKRKLTRLPVAFRISKPALTFYDLPYLVVGLFLVFVSVWRCYYFPPFPRDLTSGAEVIASYAVKEKTMINSVFSLDLSTTNNTFKPPFVASLQMIYKYIGFAFGQVWLSVLFICFILFLYSALCVKLHRLLAGLLIIFFLAIPEMYAYTFMALFDYSNAVFFFLAIYFFAEYCSLRQANLLLFSGLMMAMATYTRSETLVLACLMMPVLLWHHYRKTDGLLTMASRTLIFLLPPVLCYVLTVTIYMGHYLPVQYQVASLVNTDLLNLQPLFSRFYEMNVQLLFGEAGVNYYGYFIYIFIIILIFDLVLSDVRTRRSKNWLASIVVVYLGLAFLGYLLPLMDLDHSTKRGLFKIFPLMLLYMGSSRLLAQLSERIKNWERS